MAANPLACAVCPVRDRAACSALDEQQRSDLTRLGVHRSLKRGDVLFHAGDDGDHCATLISGALKIAQVDADGHEHILALIHPAGFVGELFAPVAHHDIVALSDSFLCMFPRRQYEELIERYPALGRALLRRSSEDLLESRALMALMTGRTARQRVAGFLLAMANAASESPCHPAARFDLPLTRGEIAALLGLTIETVSRQLTKFEKVGVIKRSGARGVELLDPARLGPLAAG